MPFLIPFCTVLLTLVPMHPVPDGLVFRGIQVVARSDRIEVRYQVGISDAMILRELQKLQGDESDVPTDAAEALACYRDRMFSQIVGEIDVKMDEKPVKLVPLRADIVRQPHAQLEFVYHVPFAPAVESVKFSLLDENYTAVPGYHLAAIRGRGGVEVLPAGADPLFERLPSIPSPVDGEPVPMPTTRKIEAYISSSAPSIVDAGQAVHEAGAAREIEELPVGTALDHDAAGTDSREDDFATRPRPSDVQSGEQVERERGSSTGHILWASVFAVLALVIAAFWMRGAGTAR